MRVFLTPTELADMLARLVRDETGMVCLEIPEACIQRESPRLVLAAPNLVRYGDRQAALTPTQHALVRCVLAAGGSVSHQDAIDSVWLGTEISESRLRKVCSEVSERFLNAGVAAALSAASGHVTINLL